MISCKTWQLQTYGHLCVRDRPSFLWVPLYVHPSAKKLRKLTHIHLPDESSTQKSSWSWLVCHFSFPWWVGKGAPKNERSTKSYMLFFGGRCIHDLQLQSTSKTCLSFQLWRGPREESYNSLIYNYRFQRWPIRKQISYAAMVVKSMESIEFMDSLGKTRGRRQDHCSSKSINLDFLF